MQEIIHKLATDQKLTEREFMSLLAAVIKETERQEERRELGQYLYCTINNN